ncbi:MAG TPA: DUF423 domain-containing protein [Casimicrobiaceae bacterium]|nr:DUF423 domain-containing protein [Casimicrobiaceae bacterium]
MTARTALTLAALLMFVAVAAGAFGAHALRNRLTPEMSAVWQTAVQYHAWHALGLAVVGLLTIHVPERAGLAPAGWLFVVGIALFSGSLYAMALTGARALGAITPVGGVAFLAGWLSLAWAASR